MHTKRRTLGRSLPTFAMFSIPLLLVFQFTITAQSPNIEKVISSIPLEGPTIEHFVPKRWVVWSKAEGDLNGDGLSDRALTISLEQNEKDRLVESGDGPPYIVVVLLAKPDGTFKRFAVNGHLYPVHGDGPPDAKIVKGVLVTNQNFRDISAIDVTHRFRFDPVTNKLWLVGFDLENYSRANYREGMKTSENYLTGVRIHSEKQTDRRTKEPAYAVTKQENIERVKIAFEDVRLKQDEDGNVLGEYAKVRSTMSGSWEWRSKPTKAKEQTYFSVDLNQKGDKVSGSLWFAMLVNGENDGSDSSSIPFIGTVQGDTATIEFDPKDFHGIEEENVRYKKSASPSIATLKFTDEKIEWNQVKGKLDDLGLGVPLHFTLERTKK